MAGGIHSTSPWLKMTTFGLYDTSYLPSALHTHAHAHTHTHTHTHTTYNVRRTQVSNYKSHLMQTDPRDALPSRP